MILFLMLFLHPRKVISTYAQDLLPTHPTLGELFYPREISPNNLTQRTEWNIIWSCFATIFACSWVAIHPNIPGPSHSSVRIFFTRLMIMGYMLFIPEMVIVWAGRQWYAARDIASRHKDRGWTITHGYFASMGGFMLYKDGAMTRTLKIEDLERLVSAHWIDWPSISEKDIQDKSKGDSFSKGIAVLQTTWFVGQCITRGVTGLMITELELVTFAFAVLNGCLYFLWWNKPLDVFRPVPVHLRRPITSEDTANSESHNNITFALFPDDDQLQVDEQLSATTERPIDLSTLFEHSSVFGRVRSYFRETLKEKRLFSPIYIFAVGPWRIICSPVISMLFDTGRISDLGPTRAAWTISVPPFYAPCTDSENRARLMGVVIGVLFGGIHCIAWCFKFLSVAENFIWRISAVNVTFLPIIITVIFATRQAPSHKRVPRVFLMALCVIVYWISRAALLILPLIALRSLPSASLVELKWSAFVPHI